EGQKAKPDGNILCSLSSRESPGSLESGHRAQNCSWVRAATISPQYRICHYPSGQVLHDRSGRVCGKRDVPLLGARTLEGLNLTVGPKRQKLVAAGPLLAAGTERSWKPCSASARVRRRSAVTRTSLHCVASAAHNDAKLVVSVVID